jgi:hypothetical protein
MQVFFLSLITCTNVIREDSMFINYIFIYAVFAIWLMLLIKLLLSIPGYIFNRKNKHVQINLKDDELPFVSVLIKIKINKPY